MSEYVSAARFTVCCAGWTESIGFSELTGFTSQVEAQEYSYNGLLGNVHTKQFGRAKPPSITLKRALDLEGFGRLFAWHALARSNAPVAKVPTWFTIMDAGGQVAAACLLENAWCAKLDIDTTAAGSANVVMMKATIECDSVLLV
ncbi:phage tail protein [Actinokineospora sp. 24-640]